MTILFRKWLIKLFVYNNLNKELLNFFTVLYFFIKKHYDTKCVYKYMNYLDVIEEQVLNILKPSKCNICEKKKIL